LIKFIEVLYKDMIRDQDRFLPIANVARIMKRWVPVNGKIAKDAKECCQECVSEFVTFITSEAAERCVIEKRKTISGDDIMWALRRLDFEDYIPTMAVCLEKFRSVPKSEKATSDHSTSSSAGDAEEKVTVPVPIIRAPSPDSGENAPTLPAPGQIAYLTQPGSSHPVPIMFVESMPGPNGQNSQPQYVTVNNGNELQVLQLAPLNQVNAGISFRTQQRLASKTPMKEERDATQKTSLFCTYENSHSEQITNQMQ
ncbi:Nuclear transcription factor Y subunit B, partial [Trichinella nelsoni]